MGQILKARGLVKIYGKRSVVADVSVEVEQGKVVGLLGPNGAGKTTCFYMIVGLVFPQEGRIFLDGRDITLLPLHERARLGVAYLPQESSLYRKLSVFENIAMALEVHHKDTEVIEAKTFDLLKKFGLEKVAESPAAALSGGERRRCEIARCMAIEPKFVLLDEPFAGIDPIAVGEIQQFIGELKQQGIGVLITDHNVRETLGTCDYGYLMKEGQVFFHGSPEEIIQNEQAKRFYLGESFTLS
ncbi:LPS export ABC transporter ATP-binding protein [bacterium]|nr:LPS export ABC transporter ATP-binding protein [bacterium]